ncbi:MAG TPA: hypothetical protein VFQ65_15485 [Kofleriaceae bacterium]|nr:hypothetical protein [Kofleriaceae bacterium]
MIVVPAARPPLRTIDGRTRRTIDRLSRRAHRFHRFAHHPLCGNYAGEILRIGRLRLCRGCSYALAGGLAGGSIALAVTTATSLSVAVPMIALAIATALIVVSLRFRPTKLVTRLAPAVLVAFAITCGVRELGPYGIALALAAIAIVGGLRVLYGKRGPDRSPCTTCPERTLQPCSGFAPIISRERAFQRVVRKLI